MSAVSDALENALDTIVIPQAEEWLNNNKATIIADLKAAEVKVGDELEAIVISAVSTNTHGVLSVVANAVSPALKASMDGIIAALGGEDEALFALALHELDVLKTEKIF